MEHLEIYKLELEHIKHENALVDNRTTWFVQFTAFLLTAYAVIAEAFAKYDVPREKQGPFHAGVLSGGSVLALVLVVAGLSTCLSTLFSVKSAYDAMDRIAEHWRKVSGAGVKVFSPYPPLLGGGVSPVATRGKRLGIQLPRVMVVLWAILGLLPAWILLQLVMGAGSR